MDPLASSYGQSGSYGGSGGYGGYGGYGGMNSASSSSSATPAAAMDTKWILASIVLLCCCVALAVWFTFIKPKASSSTSTSTSTSGVLLAPLLPGGLSAPTAPSAEQQQQQQQTQAPYVFDPDRVETREPDSKLMEFAFESLQRPGYVPNLDLSLVRKPAANPVYALVGCGVSNTRYAIRWQRKYLTVVTGDLLQWTDTKQEPNSCWALTPGYCGSGTGEAEHVMLRSAVNGSFLRVEDAVNKLVCKDAPTQKNALAYCWKLRAPQLVSAAKKDCGCRFDYDVGSVVCKPCGVATSAAPVTPAPLPGPWPELVGWDVDQAAAFLAPKAPAAAILKLACPATNPWCPATLTRQSPSKAQQQVIVLRYNEARRVIFAPRIELSS